jgi:DNA-binding transcriptional LysR family regulator
MPTLKQLRAFALASRSLSFTGAAQQLHLTPSAVSLLIRDLEDSLGTRLFERGRRLRLTPLGEQFARSADKLLVDLDLSVANLREAREAQRSVIRIGVGHLLAATVFPKAIARFTAGHPGISVQVVDCPVERLPEKVRDGEVELAIGSVAPSTRAPGVRIDHLFRDSVHLASSRSAGGLARGRPGGRVPWRRLQGEPMLLVNSENRVWSEVSATLAQLHAQLAVAHQVALYSTGIALARQNLGRLLVPGFCAQAPALADLIIERLVEPVVRWDVSALYRRGAPPRAEAQELVELLVAAAEPAIRR